MDDFYDFPPSGWPPGLIIPEPFDETKWCREYGLEDWLKGRGFGAKARDRWYTRRVGREKRHWRAGMYR